MIDPLSPSIDPLALNGTSMGSYGNESTPVAPPVGIEYEAQVEAISTEANLLAIESQIAMATLMFINQALSRNRAELEERLRETRTQEE